MARGQSRKRAACRCSWPPFRVRELPGSFVSDGPPTARFARRRSCVGHEHTAAGNGWPGVSAVDRRAPCRCQSFLREPVDDPGFIPTRRALSATSASPRREDRDDDHHDERIAASCTRRGVAERWLCASASGGCDSASREYITPRAQFERRSVRFRGINALPQKRYASPDYR